MQYNSLLQGGGLPQYVPLLLIVVVMFVFLFLPQIRKQKKAKLYYAELKKGDPIVTTGGIHGKITTVADTHFIIETEEGKLKIEKAAVSMDMTMAVYKKPAEESAKP